jgi:hypothetical protein
MIEDRLRDAMEACRDTIAPSPAFFEGIGERARQRRRQKRLRAGAAVAAAVATIIAAVVVTRPSTNHQRRPLAPAHLPSPSAQPQLYWQDDAGIARANLDGTNMVAQLVPLNGSGICGMTADRNYVYWTNHRAGSAGTVGRARHDGTGVDNSFITMVSWPPGASYNPQCVAVDGAHVYWTAFLSQDPGGPGVVGRANLDGTNVQESFISGIGNTGCGLAVDGGHIYWASADGSGIGRANLDGTGVNRNLVRGAGCGVVVDGSHIYWGAGSGIGRANLDGTGVNRDFITSSMRFSVPLPCADDGTYLYWADAGGAPASGAIGRARLDGTDVADFITGISSVPTGCAVGP